MEIFFTAIFLLLLGALLTFAGYQFFRILLPIWGFLAGFVWGAEAVAVGLGTGFLATLTGWVVGLIVALVVAALAYFFYEVAVGVLAGSLGYWLTLGLLSQMGMDPTAFFPAFLSAAAGIAVAIGVWYVKAPKWLLMVLTASAGATAAIGGLLVLFGTVPVEALGTDILNAIIGQSFLWTVSWFALATLGMFSQLVISEMVDTEVSDYSADSYDTSLYGTGSMSGAKGGQTKKTTQQDEA